MDLGENKRAKRKNNNFERKNDDLAAILDFPKVRIHEMNPHKKLT